VKASRVEELIHLFKTYNEGTVELFGEILRVAKIFEKINCNKFCYRDSDGDFSIRLISDKGFYFTGFDSKHNPIAEWFIPFNYLSLSDDELKVIHEKEMIEKSREAAEREIQELSNKITALKRRLDELTLKEIEEKNNAN